jgi:uncharacterized protein YjeT (DUF2065 family)
MTLGIAFIILGAVYIIRPNIFNMGVWRRTSIALNRLSPKQYNLYMRILGAIILAIGVYIVIIKS